MDRSPARRGRGRARGPRLVGSASCADPDPLLSAPPGIPPDAQARQFRRGSPGPIGGPGKTARQGAKNVCNRAWDPPPTPAARATRPAARPDSAPPALRTRPRDLEPDRAGAARSAAPRRLRAPGVLRDRSPGLAARRPGRRAFLSEWAAHPRPRGRVRLDARVPPRDPPADVGGARCCRRPAESLATRRAVALALLAPAAWTAAEVARWVIPVPFSFGWFRLGTLMHDTEWLVGSAAWFGTWGLTWALAALGGWAADRVDGLLRDDGAPLRAPARPPSLAHGARSARRTRGSRRGRGAARDADGPDARGPARHRAGDQGGGARPVPRHVRASGDAHPARAVRDSPARRGGGRGSARPRAVGRDLPPGKFASPEVVAAFEAGARPAPRARPLESAGAPGGDLYARGLAGVLFGDHAFRRDFGHLWPQTFGAPDGPEFSDRVLRSERLLPPGTSFLSGVEAWTAQDGMLRSVNGVVLWDAEGRPGPVAPKVHVVPGGESAEPCAASPSSSARSSASRRTCPTSWAPRSRRS